MILQNNEINNIIKTGESDTKQASINQNELQKLQYILTTGLYSDPIGSVITEYANNMIDSVVQSGKDPKLTPSIVELKSENNNYSIEFRDNGLGLNLEDFDNIIMSYLTSTKTNDSSTIGAFGLGCKSSLALERPAEWTIRKNGKESKLLFYKGASFAERDIIIENKDTTKPDGVNIKINIKSLSEYSDFKYKAKYKLGYYDEICLIIDGKIVENQIYRNDLFQWNDMYSYNEIHICLKDVFYEVDWQSLGINRINIPISLRFNLDSGLSPVPSREKLIYTESTKRLILGRIKEVANYFITKYNENTLEKETFLEAYPFIGENYKQVTLAEKQFTINDIIKYGDIPVNELKVKGIVESELKYYKRCDYFFPELNPIIDDNCSGWKRKYLYKNTKDYLLESGRKIVVVNKFPERRVKTYLQEKYSRQNILIVKESKIPFIRKIKNIKRYDVLNTKAKLKEFLFVEQQLRENFIYELDIEDSKEYIDWLEKEKEYQKQQRKEKAKDPYYVSKSLNKEEGDITLAYATKSSSRLKNFYTFEAKAYPIKNLYKNKYFTILFDKEEKDLAKEFANAIPKGSNIKIALIGKREKLRLPNLHSFKTIYNMMSEGNKKFRQIITAELIYQLLKDRDTISNIKSLNPFLNKIAENCKKLKEYKAAYYLGVSDGVWEAMKVVAIEQNLFDYSIYSTYLSVKEHIDLLDFATLLESPYHKESEETKKKRDKVITRFLLFGKKYKGAWDNFELVEKKVEPVLDEVQF